jgi:polysaccharide biosynthesis protein PslG
MNRRIGSSSARLVGVAFVLVLVLVTAMPACGARSPRSTTAAGSSAATQSIGAVEFGVNTGVLFNSGKFSAAQINAQLTSLAATGTTVVRSDALWEASEPKAPLLGIVHRYDWSFDDRIAGELAAHGLRWLPIIDYSARWAQSIPGQDHSPPASVSDYAAYAGAFASRYGPGGSFWKDNPKLTPMPVESYEIWNEPDNPQFWFPVPDAGAYDKLYLAARGAIKQAQPGAQVLVGGLVHPSAFLAAMVAADPGIAQQIDAVAIHPYAATPADVLQGVRGARLAMRADGLGSVPLYVTEFGWTTIPGGFLYESTATRAGYIEQTVASLGHTDCDVAGAFLYAWVTTQSDPTDPQDWFGISPPDAAPTAETEALTNGIRGGVAADQTIPLCSQPVTAARRSARSSHHTPPRQSRHARKSGHRRRAAPHHRHDGST